MSSIFTRILKREFEKKKQKNTQYSLRAFAKYLEVDHSLLSKVLRSKREFSTKMILRIAPKIGLSSDQVKLISKHQGSGKFLWEKIDKDLFNKVATWLTFAILETIKIPHISFSASKISKALSLDISEIQPTLDKLVSLEVISNNNGVYKFDNPSTNWFDFEHTSEVRKRLQEEFLIKSIEALKSVNFKERIHSSLTISMNRKDLPAVKEITQDYIKKMNTFISTSDKDKEVVYQLCTSFFPLSQIDFQGKEYL